MRCILYAGARYPRRQVLTAEHICIGDLDYVLAKEFEDNEWFGPEEQVSLRAPCDADASTLDLDRAEHAIHIHRDFRSLTDVLLLTQRIVMSPDAWVEYHRNLFWERTFKPELRAHEPWDDELRRRQDPESMMESQG